MVRVILAGYLLIFGISVQADTASEVADQFSEFRGQVVLVDFWASWCGPCRRSFPWMNEMQKKYGTQDFKVIAVNVDKKRDDAMSFLAKYVPQFTVWYDPDGDLARMFGVTTMPSSFILDTTGKVQAAHRGFLNQNVAQYEAAISKHVNNNQPTNNLPSNNQLGLQTSE